MVSIVPADAGLFRNVVSKPDEDFVKTNQREAWEKRMLIQKTRARDSGAGKPRGLLVSFRHSDGVGTSS